MSASVGTSLTALVTGGAGFIGHHLVRALSAAGHRVRVLDDLSAGDARRVAGLPRVAFTEGDVRDAALVRRLTAGCDVVLHHAARVSVALSVDEPEETREVNVEGTRVVLDSAAAEGVGRVTFASSAAVYGDSAASPQVETLATAPHSPYAEHKLAGEAISGEVSAGSGTRVFPLRYFNVYGPGQDDDGPYAAVIAAFARGLAGEGVAGGAPRVTLHGDGGQTRDFCSVHDVVRANLAALQDAPGDAAGQPINIGTGQATSIRELLEVMAEVLGCTPQIAWGSGRAGDIRDSVADISRAHALLGWAPQVALRDGLRELLTGAQLAPPMASSAGAGSLEPSQEPR